MWPQADYLKRMAKKDDRGVQEQILDIMLEVGSTNNYFIHRHFAEAALANAAPFETMDLLCGLLGKSTVYSLKEPDKAKPYDMSTSTRPAIEDHDQNHDFYFQHNLITALRNVAEDICRANPEKLVEIVKKLEARGWNIFRRIALYLLKVIDPAPMDLVEERLVDEELFDDMGVHHEYFHLMKQRFGKLTPGGQKQILKWIDDATRVKKYLAETERAGNAP